MKKNPQLIITMLLLLAGLAWMGRGKIRQLFPPKMKFAQLQLTGIDDGKVTSISEQEGKVLIVSCYQTWCGDCARETPILNELAGKINNDHFKVIYVSQETAEKVAAFRHRFASNNILFTQTSQTPDQLGIQAFPTTFLINKNGIVVKTKLEGYNWMDEESNIRRLLTE